MEIFDEPTIKDIKNHLGALVKLVRKKNGLNQDELAAKLNISRITISNLELGKNITLDVILKVLQYFDMLDGFKDYIKSQVKVNQQASLY